MATVPNIDPEIPRLTKEQLFSPPLRSRCQKDDTGDNVGMFGARGSDGAKTFRLASFSSLKYSE